MGQGEAPQRGYSDRNPSSQSFQGPHRNGRGASPSNWKRFLGPKNVGNSPLFVLSLYFILSILERHRNPNQLTHSQPTFLMIFTQLYTQRNPTTPELVYHRCPAKIPSIMDKQNCRNPPRGRCLGGFPVGGRNAQSTVHHHALHTNVHLDGSPRGHWLEGIMRYGGFQSMQVPTNQCSMRENPTQMDVWGVPLFQETSIWRVPIHGGTWNSPSH